LDETELLPDDEISIYKSLLGSAHWIITLGRYDIACATNTLSRYSMAPRKGHMKAMHRVFGYLRNKFKGQLLISVNQPPVRDTIDTIVMPD
jgi:hypothetical protein